MLQALTHMSKASLMMPQTISSGVLGMGPLCVPRSIPAHVTRRCRYLLVYPRDTTAQMHLESCRMLSAERPSNWSGVRIMTSK
jgi:hypothetical protein